MLSSFSQTVTTNDTLVSLPITQLRKAMYELQYLDICRTEVRMQDTLINSLHGQIKWQDSIIITYVVKDSLHEQRNVRAKELILIKDSRISQLESDVKKYKGASVLLSVATILILIL